MTTDLYTPTEVKNIRESLLKEQDNKCLILGIDIKPSRTAVLDHRHDDEQLVRGVIEREVNAMCGAAEGAYKRHLKYWCDIPLPSILRCIADYLENTATENRYRHPKWQAKVKTKFNTLNSKQQDAVLIELGSSQGKNLKERKELFNKIVLDRSKGFEYITKMINKVKGDT